MASSETLYNDFGRFLYEQGIGHNIDPLTSLQAENNLARYRRDFDGELTALMSIVGPQVIRASRLFDAGDTNSREALQLVAAQWSVLADPDKEYLDHNFPGFVREMQQRAGQLASEQQRLVPRFAILVTYLRQISTKD